MVAVQLPSGLAHDVLHPVAVNCQVPVSVEPPLPLAGTIVKFGQPSLLEVP
jgi:hypothetical protein